MTRAEPRRRRPVCVVHLAETAQVAPMFAALGDPTRLQLLLQLRRDGAQSITRLTLSGNISRQAVTKHLQALERARLVRSIRAGREHRWELQQQRLLELRGYLDQISSQWDEALERLRNLVES